MTDEVDNDQLESVLLDLADIDLAQLDGLPDSVLASGLRRILTEEPGSPGQYAAFRSSL